MNSIEQIIKNCIGGDIKSQQQLYEMFSSKLFGVCLKYSSSYEEAQDHFQEGFIIIFNSLSQLKNAITFELWAKRIMINYILQQYRKKNYLVVINEYKDDIEENQTIEVPEIGWEKLLSLIQQLPERYRMVFNLYVFENHSHAEIAQLLSISTGTSKSNLARAKMILRDKINQFYKTSNYKVE